MHRTPRPLAVYCLAALVAPAIANAQQAAPPGTPAAAAPGTAPPADGTTATTPGTSAAATETPAATERPAPAATMATPPPAPTTPALAIVPVRRWFDGFSFGSYGRVVIGTDLRGQVARPANIVAFGPRIANDQTYAELEVHRDDTFGAVHTRVVATLAITGPLFHESGTFDARLAVRNLYIEETGVLSPRLSLWMGSRMYRGDDIYLLNWWPLDNLNTVGGGARYDASDNVTLYAHVGSNRLDSPYQVQQAQVTPRDGFVPTTLNLLDRPRAIGSAKVTWWLLGRTATYGVKLSAYGEYHALPDGTRRNADSGQLEGLPADWGLTAGAQVGAYSQRNYVNLFFRYSQGLAAYGDLAVPYTRTAMQTSERARDVRLALSAGGEWGAVGVLVGAYLRYFRDADAALYGRNALWEGAIVVRPTVWFGQHVGLSLDASYQAQVYNTLDPVTGTGAAGGSLWRFALVPFISPAGRGNYTRPHIRAIYSVTLRDGGAQRLYAPDDPYAQRGVEHFLGLGCEWWFNSSYL